MMPIRGFTSTFALAADVPRTSGGKIFDLLAQHLQLRFVPGGVQDIMIGPIIINNLHIAIWSMSDHLRSVEPGTYLAAMVFRARLQLLRLISGSI